MRIVRQYYGINCCIQPDRLGNAAYNLKDNNKMEVIIGRCRNGAY